MNERKTKTRYDYGLLKKYCEENGVTLKKDYSKEKVLRDTIIEAKCLKCDDVCSKGFRQFMNTGCFCKIHINKNRNEKVKATNMENFGVEYASQNKEVKDKIKATNLERYGCENPFQNKEVKDKIKATNMENFGVEYASQNKEVKDKIKATNMEKFGVEYASQNKEVREKVKATCLKKFGVECALQNKEVKDKIKATNMERYGCEYPNQNTEVSEKASKNAYKSYDYIFPSGRIERIQGYEKYMLNDLLQKENISEDDIIVSRSEVPSVWYEDLNGKKRRYFVDCFIKSQNRCIETKSTWTAEKKQDYIYVKQQALKDSGYKCEIWIYNTNGQIVEKIV